MNAFCLTQPPTLAKMGHLASYLELSAQGGGAGWLDFSRFAALKFSWHLLALRSSSRHARQHAFCIPVALLVHLSCAAQTRHRASSSRHLSYHCSAGRDPSSPSVLELL